MIVISSFVLRAWLAREMLGPFIMVDELIYSELARSFAAGDGFQVRDVPATGFSLVYPILISPAYRLFDSLPEAYAAVKQALVGVERALGGQAQAPQRRTRELHGRLRAGGDEVAVGDRALVDVAVTPAVAGGRQVFGSGAGVVSLVKQPGAGEAGGCAADRRHRDAGIEKTRGRRGERLPAAGVPHITAGQDEELAGGGLQVGE